MSKFIEYDTMCSSRPQTPIQDESPLVHLKESPMSENHLHKRPSSVTEEVDSTQPDNVKPEPLSKDTRKVDDALQTDEAGAPSSGKKLKEREHAVVVVTSTKVSKCRPTARKQFASNSVQNNMEMPSVSSTGQEHNSSNDSSLSAK